MKCPFCSYTESKVIDTRPTDEGERIRRRRECLVFNKDGSRYAFSHDKRVRGVLKSC